MKTACKSPRQAGVALLEAMIAILIFSFGVLGVVAMQATATKTASDARYRTEAALLGDEILGRMWSNIPSIGGYSGLDTNIPATFPATCLTDETPPAVRCRWGQMVLAKLPAARARITATATTIVGSSGWNVAVTINWTPPGSAETRQFDVGAFVVDR